jgi:hypothetical protein
LLHQPRDEAAGTAGVRILKALTPSPRRARARTGAPSGAGCGRTEFRNYRGKILHDRTTVWRCSDRAPRIFRGSTGGQLEWRVSLRSIP